MKFKCLPLLLLENNQRCWTENTYLKVLPTDNINPKLFIYV